MGYTTFTKELVKKYIDEIKPKFVGDLGAQNDFTYPLPAPYISEWYRSMGIGYACIDLNEENNALPLDLGKEIKELPHLSFIVYMDGRAVKRDWDIVVDAGTSEHVGTDGEFDWAAIYNCWITKHKLCRIGGLIISENPKTGHWEKHGFQWYTVNFYKQLEKVSGYELLEVGEFPAMGNWETGMNVFSVMRKTDQRFPTLKEFKELDLRQS